MQITDSLVPLTGVPVYSTWNDFISPPVPFINTKVYPLELIILFMIGSFLWVIAYAIIIRNIHKHKIVEMPTVVGCGNFAWEILWSVYFIPNMGLLCLWGYRAWMILDIYIFGAVLWYGVREVKNELIRQWFRPMVIFGLLAWAVVFFFFTTEDFDTPLGANSAYILNLVISLLYPFRILRKQSIVGFSYSVAWLKMLGTGLISVFMVIYYPENHTLHTLAALILIADIAYIVVFHWRRTHRISAPVVA